MKSESVKHTPLPWVVDDKCIHRGRGLAYPNGQEPETDLIVAVDTDCHENGLLHPTDKANLQFIARACNSHFDLLVACKDALSFCQPNPPMYRQLQAAIAKAEGNP